MRGAVRGGEEERSALDQYQEATLIAVALRRRDLADGRCSESAGRRQKPLNKAMACSILRRIYFTSRSGCKDITAKPSVLAKTLARGSASSIHVSQETKTPTIVPT